MRLLIISAMPHYFRDGEIVGWGPTVQEIDQLATLFTEIRHVCAVHSEPAPASALPYRAENITVIPLPASGGHTLRGKYSILRNIPLYVRSILREIGGADIVHVRCPANISLIGVLLLSLRFRPKRSWVKYAGNWRPEKAEPWSYTLQRLWLKQGLHRGLVTVNGLWPGQAPHIHSFLNPCLTEEDLESAETAALRRRLSTPLRIIFVGRLERDKGVGQVLRIVNLLQERGIRVRADLVGDGPERAAFESLASQLGLDSIVQFHGWLPRPALNPLYSEAHFMLLPSRSEGWPKVLSEAMAFGVVPLASTVSCIPQFLEGFQTGRAIPAGDIAGYVDAIQECTVHSEIWLEGSRNAAKVARRFGYSHYLKAVSKLLDHDTVLHN